MGQASFDSRGTLLFIGSHVIFVIAPYDDVWSEPLCFTVYPKQEKDKERTLEGSLSTFFIGRKDLSFGELETTTGAFASVFFPLFDSWIAGQQSASAQSRAKFRINFQQRFRDAMTNGSCLS